MRLRRLIKVLAVLSIVALVLAAVIWRLSWAAPSWYRPPPPSDPAAATLAESVENRIIEESHKVRPAEDAWTLRVRSEQVNAWVGSRLPRWLIHEQDVIWPEQLGTPQIRLTDDGVDLAIQFMTDGRPRVVVVRVVPEIIDQRLFMMFDRLSLGRVAMPGYTLEDLVRVASAYGADEVMQQPEAAWLLKLLAGRDSLDPVATLADDRRVRLMEIRLGDGYLDLTMQTLPPRKDPQD